MNLKPIFGLFILALTLTGCSAAVRPSLDSATPAPQGSQEPSTDGEPIDLTLTTLDGQTISLADYRGSKAVVLDFWASWCPNCRRDLPNLQEFSQEYPDQLVTIGINLQETRGTVERFVTQQGLTFPIVLDPAGKLSSQFGVLYTNYHVLINRDGQIVEAIPGDLSPSRVTELVGAPS